MRRMFIAMAIGALVGLIHEKGLCESPPPQARSEKIEHLLKAAAHLEAAGQIDDAQKLRDQIEKEKALAEGDIKAMQAEIERLRGLTSHPMQVLLHVRILEVSPEKLKAVGIDSRGSHVFDPKDRLLKAIESMSNVKVLASPTMVTLSNRACSFHSGGQIPLPSSQGGNTTTIDWKRYGTSVEFLPVVLADRSIRMECRAEVSELDRAHNVNVAGCEVPGIRSRSMDTATEIRSGQTLLVGGMTQSREVDGTKSEIETLVLLTPEIVEPMAVKP